MKRVLVGLGSNIEPERSLRRAVSKLREHFFVVAVSGIYQSPPADGSDQADYMNCAALVRTNLLPGAAKRALGEIETALGRVRTADRYAARTIDLDMVLYGALVFDLGSKHVPDVDLLRRPFVAVPAAELLPDMPHPETGEVLAAIARRLGARGELRRVDVAIA